MIRHHFIVAAVLLAACAIVSLSAAASAAPGPIAVQECNPSSGAASPGYVAAYYPAGPFWWQDVYGYRYYEPRMTAPNPTLSIGYMNTWAKPASSVEFGLVARGDLVAEVKDVGTFSQNAAIKHRFGLNPNVFPLGTGLARCVPLRVTFADGSHWRNPRLPALRRTLYTH